MKREEELKKGLKMEIKIDNPIDLLLEIIYINGLFKGGLDKELPDFKNLNNLVEEIKKRIEGK
jgi:hypothetical protein